MIYTLLERSSADCDGGNLIGRHPDEISRSEFDEAGVALPRAMDAIRSKCIDCCGGVLGEVRKCTAVTCALWTMRLGHYPRARLVHD